MAKSLLWVQNMANNPALPKFRGLATNNDTTITLKNIIAFAISIAKRNHQFTMAKFSSARDMKIKLGSAKFPTNVFRPFASVCEMMLNRPATYLSIYKSKMYCIYLIILYIYIFYLIIMHWILFNYFTVEKRKISKGGLPAYYNSETLHQSRI